MIAPAMPVVIGHNRTFLALFGLAANTEFNYPKYFSMVPVGPDGGSGLWRALSIDRWLRRFA